MAKGVVALWSSPFPDPPGACLEQYGVYSAPEPFLGQQDRGAGNP